MLPLSHFTLLVSVYLAYYSLFRRYPSLIRIYMSTNHLSVIFICPQCYQFVVSGYLQNYPSLYNIHISTLFSCPKYPFVFTVYTYIQYRSVIIIRLFTICVSTASMYLQNPNFYKESIFEQYQCTSNIC
jgi:hypothetical protein